MVALIASGSAWWLARPHGRGTGQRISVTNPPSPRPPRPPAIGPIGRYRVALRSLVVVDRARPGLGARYLPTLVRYPIVPAPQVAAGIVARGPFPLVVFAPGYLQCRSSYDSLLAAWASAGYLVAAVEFPRTRCRVASPDEADLSNQPADISAVISKLLAASAKPGGVLTGLIDPTKIAVAGHSDGGDTAAAVAANTCCLDHRVRAAVILSGAEWPPLGGRYFPRGSPPVLFVQGTADTWNPPAASVQLYRADRVGIRYYLDLPGADHFTPYEGRSRPEPLVARVTVAFLNTYLDGQQAQAAALAMAGTVRGVARLYTDGHLPR
jgi:pimeloyl-ACP methyl ester carboxylesterase